VRAPRVFMTRCCPHDGLLPQRKTQSPRVRRSNVRHRRFRQKVFQRAGWQKKTPRTKEKKLSQPAAAPRDGSGGAMATAQLIEEDAFTGTAIWEQPGGGQTWAGGDGRGTVQEAPSLTNPKRKPASKKRKMRGPGLQGSQDAGGVLERGLLQVGGFFCFRQPPGEPSQDSR